MPTEEKNIFLIRKMEDFIKLLNIKPRNVQAEIGYAELIFKDRYLVIIQIFTLEKVEVKIPSFGEFECLIKYDYLYSLLDKLCK